MSTYDLFVAVVWVPRGLTIGGFFAAIGVLVCITAVIVVLGRLFFKSGNTISDEWRNYYSRELMRYAETITKRESL